MALVPHWRRVLRRAWSVQLTALAMLPGLVYLVVDALDTYWFAAADHVSPVPFFLIGIALKAAAMATRAFYQPELHK